MRLIPSLNPRGLDVLRHLIRWVKLNFSLVLEGSEDKPLPIAESTVCCAYLWKIYVKVSKDA